jgi:hypothetical protein
MSLIISETGNVVIILPYVRDAVQSAEAHHTHNPRTHCILFADGHDKFKTLSLLSCVGVQWTDSLGETFPLQSCPLNDVYFGL